MVAHNLDQHLRARPDACLVPFFLGDNDLALGRGLDCGHRFNLFDLVQLMFLMLNSCQRIVKSGSPAVPTTSPAMERLHRSILKASYLREIPRAASSIIPVDHPVLDGLGDVGGADVGLAGQVGDRPRHPEHPVVGPGA